MASCMRDRIIGYFPLAERTCFSQGVKRILISDPYLSLSFTIKGTVCGAKLFLPGERLLHGRAPPLGRRRNGQALGPGPPGAVKRP
jgi:hypothetical protein